MPTKRPSNGSTTPDYLSRRGLIAGAAAGSLVGGPSWASPPATLAGAARAAGLRFGAAVRASALDQPRLRDVLAREAATLTPELELKWAALEPAAGRRHEAGADRIAAFARGHGKRLRGHTLLWHRSVPDWAARELASGGGWDIVARHIDATVGRYGALVDEWDVVNEPIEIGARPDGLRANAFIDAFGSDYIARALRAAHAAAPRARLFVNEYDLEYDLPAHRARRAALLRLATTLIERGVPLHGVGIQAHLDLGKGELATDELRGFVAALAALGLTVAVTELDCKEVDYIRPADERDRLVAAHVAGFLAAVLPHPAISSASCWGLTDDQSWLEVTAADRARFPGAWADGSSPGFNRGLPFDAAGRPKAMRDALLAAFAARPRS